MNKNEHKKIVDRYLTGKGSAADRKLMDDAIKRGYRQGKKDHSLRSQPNAFLKEQIWSTIQQGMDKKSQPWKYVWRVAAAVTLVLGVSAVLYLLLFQPRLMITQVAEAGQTQQITLPDGSVVTLNSNSSITYPGHFTDDARHVTLQGEAFFEVAHDATRPFTVESGDINTTVLGTSFNVCAYPEEADIRVTLVTGKVRVGSKQGAVTHLTPSEQAVFSKATNSLQENIVNIENAMAWRNGILLLNGSFDAVAKQLQRAFGKTIVFKNQALRACGVEAKYNHETLENILESLRYTHNITYTIQENQVVINGAGCP